jgi:hypothetical protein
VNPAVATRLASPRLWVLAAGTAALAGYALGRAR